MNGGLVTIGLALLGVGFLFYLFEKSRYAAKEIPLFAILAGIAAASRIPFAMIPGVQPTTFIIILSGIVFGPLPGAMIGLTAAFTSNIFLGQGPWTLWQMVGWGSCGCVSGLVGMRAGNIRGGALMLYAALWGYLFGALMNFWYWYSFVYPHSLSTWITVNAASLPFDTLHAAGNAVLVLLFGKTILLTLHYFRRRLEFSRIPG
jgi:energy-coupling factor transport system substrate-specific component